VSIPTGTGNECLNLSRIFIPLHSYLGVVVIAPYISLALLRQIGPNDAMPIK